jgi:hypothetical protein
LFVGVTLWPFVPGPETGTPPTGDRSSSNVGQTPSGPPAQRSAESSVGKSDPSQEDVTGGKARAIKQTSQEVHLTSQQRQQLRAVVAKPDAPRVEQAAFELMIGAAVPRQVRLIELPAEASEILGGYWANDYLIVKDRLVVVDGESRRVVAIIPEMT